MGVGAADGSSFGERLYGSLTTREGYTLTGFVCWDIDEVLTQDVLDGNDEQRRRRKIKMDNIKVIGRESSSSAYVQLKNGEEIVLRGTNDVNNSNSGILVLDPDLGQVQVSWSDFGEVVFQQPNYIPTYDDFSVISRLSGTVYTQDGDAFEGYIRWDDDEEFTWELLDGEMDDLEFDIEFGKIRSIKRISSRAAEITLFDGRSFELRDSNDVDSDNDGIFILDEKGDEVHISWRDFERVVFDKP